MKYMVKETKENSMGKQQYTIFEVLQIIKTQLEVIPVSGESVRTMASVFTNIDVLIEIFTPIEKEEPKKE